MAGVDNGVGFDDDVGVMMVSGLKMVLVLMKEGGADDLVDADGCLWLDRCRC
ncbi:hypothetical protein [Insulibacter thermoxylanivorax]|uniref:hypothetical protein n=1 Tax=Insulibacter thermoxylanivorax TaxID=2749268 RepID=UPI001910AA80|nr:hypothetical protein [Insulibacter thermoxylanivorax]